MGRKPDPNKKALRQEAARLESEGFSAAQIALKMGVRNVKTVQSWLRQERGPKKPLYKPKVLKRLQEGELSLTEIASAVECSYENVRKIEREWRRELKKTWRSGSEIFQEYLKDPSKKIDDRFTRYESFQRRLVDYCNHLANTDPIMQNQRSTQGWRSSLGSSRLSKLPRSSGR